MENQTGRGLSGRFKTQGSSNNNTESIPSHSKHWMLILSLQTAAIFICYADRSNISTAIIPMSEQYGWDSSLQGLILSSFFFGYVATQLVGGWLSDKYGGKNVLSVGVVVWALSTMATPGAAYMGPGPLVINRIIMGLGEGVAFPAIHSMISRCVPDDFQSTAVAIFTSASYLGVAVAFYLSPVIIDKLGWEWVFYIFGITALLWIPLWIPQNFKDNDCARQRRKKDDDSPREDTSEEIELSQEFSETKPLVQNTNTNSSSSQTSQLSSKIGSKLQINFGLFRRKQVWAIGIAQYAQSWGMYGLLSWLPSFFKDEYHVDIQDLGVYTFFPYFAQAAVGSMAGVLADKMIARGYSVRYVRISIQTVSMLGPACCLLLSVSPLSTSNPDLATWFVTLGTGLSALSVASVSVNQLDIAPKNAGLIFAFGNTCATAAGLISVQLTGVLLDNFHSWGLIFGLTSLHYVLGAVFWALWVGGERLPEDEKDSY